MCFQEYDDRAVSSRNNGDYDDRRGYTEYGGNEMNQRSYPAVSPRTPYAPTDFLEDKRLERNVYDSDDRRQVEYDDPQPRRSYSNSDKVYSFFIQKFSYIFRGISCKIYNFQ